jgi:hypothetical protein
MPENQRVEIPFGGSLDRDTGVMVVRPGSFEDLRNVLIHEGKAIVRPGFGSELQILDDTGAQVSHVIQGHPLRAERLGIVVSYQSTTEKVWVHRVNDAGTIAELLGEWVNDRSGGWGSDPPVVHMAEVYSRVFMAHDTRLVSGRAQTIYYDPIFGTGNLTGLTNEFTTGGPHKTRFRGVCRHLGYTVGWGYGDEDVDGPEIVRLSKPGEPTVFEKNGYGPAGNRRDAVLRCAPAGRNLVILKEAEAHVLRGYSRANFGIEILDPQFGILAGGLAVNVGKLLLAWSAEGPRAWDGEGASTDLAIPLDLGGLEPSSLVPQGEAERAFAFYVPDLRVAIFVFGTRVYALTTRVPNDWKWSYWELGFTAYCAFTLVTGSQLATAPTGHPEWGSSTPAGSYVDISVNHVDQDGDETMEVWLKPAAGSWAKATISPSLVSPTSPQTFRVSGLVPGTAYDGALRYRRGVLYATLYQNADPATWPGVSQGSLTTVIDPPTPVSGVWSRVDATNEKVTLTVTPAAGQEAQDIEVFRNAVSIGTISGPHSGDAVFDDTTVLGITPETAHAYTFVTKGGTDSPPSAAINVWVGPAGVPSITDVQPWQQGEYSVGFTTPDVTLETEVHDNYDDAGGIGGFALRVTAAAAAPNADSGTLTGLPVCTATIEVAVRVRLKVTSFTVDDFGDWSDEADVDLCEVP